MRELCAILAMASLMAPMAMATEATENNPSLEIFYGERTAIAVKGVLKAVTADPNLLELELDGGQLFITARKSGRTLVYLWTAEGLQVYMVTSRAAHRVNPQDRPQRMAIQRSQTGLSGSYGNHLNLNWAAVQQRLLLGQNFTLEYPLTAQERIFGRINQLAQIGLNSSYSTVTLPFIQASYQSPSVLGNVGNLVIHQPIQIASGLGAMRGGSISFTQPLSRYDAFIGSLARPLTLWSDNVLSPTQEPPLLIGGSGTWRLPLNLFEQAGNLEIQGLATTQITPSLQPTLAGGVTWNHPQTRLQLALGNRLRESQGVASAVLAQAFYHHTWPSSQSNLNITGQYRHFGNSYQQPNSAQQDIFNLRANHRWGEWNLSSSMRLNLLSGSWHGYQLSARLNRQIKPWAMNLYVQGNSSGLGLDRHLQRGTVGLRWQQGIAGHTNYQWQVNQSPLYPDQHNHQLQLQLRLFQNPQWQVQTQAQSSLQGLGIDSQTLWNQQIMLNAHHTLSPEWQWQNSLAYYLNIPLVPRDWPQTVHLQTGIHWVSALQQARITANYQYYHQGQGNHLWGLSTSYTWRFGYESESQARLQGRVYHDRNGNGQYDEGEAGLEGVQIQIGNQVVSTRAQGDYELSEVSQAGLRVSLQPSSLPPGYQVIGPSTLELQRNGNETLAANFPVAQQISVEGFAFASPLLSRGLAQIQVTLDGKQSILTQSDGRYHLITTPGRHEVRVNPLSIPPGYRLQGPLSRTIDSTSNARIDFVFVPLIRLELQCLDQPEGKTVAGLKAYLAHAPEELESSDAQGLLSFDVPAGSVQIVFPTLQRDIEILIPDQPGVIKQQLYLSELGPDIPHGEHLHAQ